MNSIKKVSLVLIAITLIIMTLVRCQDQELIKQNDETELLVNKTLEQETPLDDLILPIGTKITIISDSQINFELPDDFKFLLFDEENGVSYSTKGGYSCTCSATKSCKVIYNSSVGYGCLQNDCTGSCTGTPTSKPDDRSAQIYGVLNMKSKELIGDIFIDSGHLSQKGYDIFFEEIANNKIIEFYDFVYEPTEFKNSSDFLNSTKEENVTQVVLQYLGISFVTVVPNFDDVKNSQIINFKDTGRSVSCAGSNGCICSKSKKCILGNCVYYCDGCTTCTMTVNK